jgi:TctA family transporter
MVGPSVFFYAIFVIPYILFMYWLVKQDKKKYMWGVIVVTVVAIFGLVVSQRASKIAMENYKQHQIDAREIEAENKADSLKQN